jgi:hypothetical protein
MNESKPVEHDLVRDKGLAEEVALAGPVSDEQRRDYILTARHGWPQAIRRALAAEVEARRLRAAIVKHRSQRADDRCHQDDLELYAALGDGVQADNTMPPREEFLANCARFYDRRCQGGDWPSYQQLEAENARLRLLVEAADALRCAVVSSYGPSLVLSDPVQAAAAAFEELAVRHAMGAGQPDDAGAVYNALIIYGYSDEVSLGTVQSWTREQRRQVLAWVGPAIARANDNDVTVPPRPQFLPDIKVWGG